MKKKKGPNIVQVEFFHVGKASQSLEEVLEECVERALDNYPIKTVVRFFDTHGSITTFVLRQQKQRWKYRNCLTAASESSGLWQMLQIIRHERLGKQLNSLKEHGKQLAIKELKKTIELKRQVAVEHDDHSFRNANKNELHDLMESASMATDVWFIVFEPHDLLFDKNIIVAHAT